MNGSRAPGPVARAGIALCAALGAASSGIQEDGRRTDGLFWRRVRCHVLRWHDWTTFANPDGECYRACSICDTDEPTAAFPRGFPLTS
jgi:hypothetical protein